ncbi:MAG TPA: hypothetical protein VKF59_22995, partial [Candidatus Dormibacteraeota bacterium]|nr:hypothetical protein [Candidatus Dormibacteraeota bacterium]
AGWDVKYLLVPRDTPLDALTRTYPSIYATGAGIGTLVREFQSSGDPDVWKLYRVQPAGPLSAPAPPPPVSAPPPPVPALPPPPPATAPAVPPPPPPPVVPASAPRPADAAPVAPAPAPPPPLLSPPSRPPPAVREDVQEEREEGVIGLRREEGLTRRRRRGARRNDREIRDD